MAEVTADGDIIIGRPRPKNNPLIRRSEVGKPSFHNDLPPLPSDYTFGARLKKDPEGAGDVVLTWHSHQPPKSKMTYDFGRDFVKLNTKAIKQNCISSKETADYRKGNDARIKPKLMGKTKKSIAPESVISDPNHSFGAPSGASDCVADLIQNRYENEWVMEQKARCEALEASKNKEKERRKLKAAAATLAAQQQQGGSSQRNINNKTPTAGLPPLDEEYYSRGGGARSHTPGAMMMSSSSTEKPHPKEYFTLKKFKNVPSRFSAQTPPVGDYE